MREGLQVTEAQQVILEHTPVLEAETVATREALGRVLAAAVESARTLPPADCSAMDGYAVRAADLAGASEANPVELEVGFVGGGSGRRRRDQGRRGGPHLHGCADSARR